MHATQSLSPSGATDRDRTLMFYNAATAQRGESLALEAAISRWLERNNDDETAPKLKPRGATDCDDGDDASDYTTLNYGEHDNECKCLRR
jgi:hypothetical protein